MDNTIPLNPDKTKILMTVNAIEKQMRKMMKDIRRFEPKLAKALKNYNNAARNMEVKKKTLKAMSTKRDNLLIGLDRMRSQNF